MTFVLVTYPLPLALVITLCLLSLMLLPKWIQAARHIHGYYRLQPMMSVRALLAAILLLMLPTLAIAGSVSLFTAVRSAPCRSDYTTNTNAPLAPSIVLITHPLGSKTDRLATIRVRDGVIEEPYQASSVSTRQSSTSISLSDTSTYPLKSSPSTYPPSTLQTSTYSLRTSWVNPTSSAQLNLSIISTDSQSGLFQWKRELRISEKNTGDNPLQISRFGNDLYLHGGSTLFALNAMSGATRWQREIGYSSGANTIEASNVVYAPGNTDDGRAALYALNTKNGEPIWQCTRFGFGAQFIALALYHGVLFADSRKVFPHYYDFTRQLYEPANAVFALNAQDGAVYWRTVTMG